MTTRINAIAVLGLCLGVPLILAPSCTISFVTPEAVTSTETETVSLPAGAAVVVSNEFGTTTVNVDESAEVATVQIVRVAYAASEEDAQDLLGQMQVTITEPTGSDNRLVITAQAAPGATSSSGSFNMSVSSDDVVITSILFNARIAKYRLTITLPPGHGVQATQNAGLLRATGLDTASSLTGSAASIRASDSTAGLTIETDAGSIDVTSHTGSLTASTSAGSATIDISALQSDDEVNVQVEAGSISARLPSAVAADLEATTDAGSVSFEETDWNVAVVTTNTFRRVVATLNGGGAVVTLATEVGSIDIDAR